MPAKRLFLGVLLATGGVTGCRPEPRHGTPGDADLDWPERWVVDPVPVVEIGSEEAGAAFRFNRVVGVVRLSTGEIVVADAGSSEVRAFSSDGRHHWTAGRPGDGPGDFFRLSWIAVDGRDTLVAYDNRAPARFTWIGPDGAILGVKSISFRTRCGPPVPGLTRGRVVVADCHRDALPAGRQLSAQFLVVGDPRSGATRRLADVPGGEIEVLPGGSWRGVAYGVRPALAARDSLIAYGNGERYEIQLFSPGGSRLRGITLPLPRRPVTDADKRLYLERLAERIEALARSRGRSPAALVEKGAPVRTPSFADSLPSFGALHIDPDQDVWVGEFRGGGEPPERWMVFRLTGEPLAELRVPAGFTIHGIGTGELLGVLKDADGRERVMAYRFDRDRSQLLRAAQGGTEPQRAVK